MEAVRIEGVRDRYKSRSGAEVGEVAGDGTEVKVGMKGGI